MPKSIKEFRDAEKARQYRNKQRANNYRQTSECAFASHQRWTEYETEMIFDSSLSDREIAKKIGRSVQAIQQKRCILKKGR